MNNHRVFSIIALIFPIMVAAQQRVEEVPQVVQRTEVNHFAAPPLADLSLWNQTLGYVFPPSRREVLEVPGGDILIFGLGDGRSAGQCLTGFRVTRMSASGEPISAAVYGVPNKRLYFESAVIAGNSIVLGGHTGKTGREPSSIILITIDGDGEIRHERRVSAAGNLYLQEVGAAGGTPSNYYRFTATSRPGNWPSPVRRLSTTTVIWSPW